MIAAMQIEEQFDIPIAKGPALSSAYQNALAICNTALLLKANGGKVDDGILDKHRAAVEVGNTISGNNTASAPGDFNVSVATASAIEQILGQYHHDVLKHANYIRNMVVTELMYEVRNPRNKMHALQLLGKIPEVGLFVDRVFPETPQAKSSEVAERLRQRLKQVVTENTVKAEIQDVDVLGELNALRKTL